MIYKPEKGGMWDPSVIWHDGKYYAFMMYDKDGHRALYDSRYCLMASSTNGVHWKDEGIVIEEREIKKGTRFFKCFVGRCGSKFVMVHGVYRKREKKQDTLRFYESSDLKNWKYLYSNKPDPRWYTTQGKQLRWDHMYIIPKEEGNPKAGYFGHVVAAPKKGMTPAIGMMQSKNGTTWQPIPLAKVEWGDIPPRNLEWGGCEQIGGKYYIIGGAPNYLTKAYSMYTLVSDSPRGPFRPDVEAYRLCGHTNKYVTWLASWVRGDNELLISNYVSMRPYYDMPWLLPLRKPVVDEQGHLCLGWWKGNEKLKGKPLAIKKTFRLNNSGKTSDYTTTFINKSFDFKTGIVLQGKIKAFAVPTDKKESSAGFLFERKRDSSKSMALLLGVGKVQNRRSRIGHLYPGPDGKNRFRSEDITGPGCATVTGIEDGKEHSFRLLIRYQVFELYIDDLLMQTYMCDDFVRIGFIASNARVEFNNLKAWKMKF